MFVDKSFISFLTLKEQVTDIEILYERMRKQSYKSIVCKTSFRVQMEYKKVIKINCKDLHSNIHKIFYWPKRN